MEGGWGHHGWWGCTKYFAPQIASPPHPPDLRTPHPLRHLSEGLLNQENQNYLRFPPEASFGGCLPAPMPAGPLRRAALWAPCTPVPERPECPVRGPWCPVRGTMGVCTPDVRSPAAVRGGILCLQSADGRLASRRPPAPPYAPRKAGREGGGRPGLSTTRSRPGTEAERHSGSSASPFLDCPVDP